jgi:hypothetical protein
MRERLSYANVMASLALFIAIGGSATAALSGKDKKTVKKIVATEVSKQSGTLSVKHATTADSAGTAGGASPTGAAGGDLAGSYPSPSLRGADAVTLAGLGDAPAGSCSGLPTNNWYDVRPPAIGIGFNEAGYYRDKQGRVFLQGAVKACGASAPQAIFTLPTGFRPLNIEQLAAIKSGDFGTILVEPGGQVETNGLPADGDSYQLGGISFRCAPSGANGCP